MHNSSVSVAVPITVDWPDKANCALILAVVAGKEGIVHDGETVIGGHQMLAANLTLIWCWTQVTPTHQQHQIISETVMALFFSIPFV